MATRQLTEGGRVSVHLTRSETPALRGSGGPPQDGLVSFGVTGA